MSTIYWTPLQSQKYNWKHFKEKVSKFTNQTTPDDSTKLIIDNLDQQWSGIQDELSIIIQYFTLFDKVLKDEASEMTTKPNVIQRFEDKLETILSEYNPEGMIPSIPPEAEEEDEDDEEETEDLDLANLVKIAEAEENDPQRPQP